MSTEIVTLVVGKGSPALADAEVAITAAIDEAVRTLNVEAAETSGTLAFAPGTPITVYAGSSPLLVGYVNSYHGNIGSRARSIKVQGRSRGQDFVDCSSEHPTGYARKKTPLEFAQELDSSARTSVISSLVKLDR